MDEHDERLDLALRQAGLLVELPARRRRRRFPGLDLPARKLEDASLVGVVGPSRDEHAPVADRNRQRDLDPVLGAQAGAPAAPGA